MEHHPHTRAVNAQYTQCMHNNVSFSRWTHTYIHPHTRTRVLAIQMFEGHRRASVLVHCHHHPHRPSGLGHSSATRRWRASRYNSSITTVLAYSRRYSLSIGSSFQVDLWTSGTAILATSSGNGRWHNGTRTTMHHSTNKLCASLHGSDTTHARSTQRSWAIRNRPVCSLKHRLNKHTSPRPITK